MSDYWDEMLNTDSVPANAWEDPGGSGNFTQQSSVADPWAQPDASGGYVQQTENYGYSTTDYDIQESLRDVAFAGRAPETYSWAGYSSDTTENRLNTDIQGGAGQAIRGYAADPRQPEEKGLIGRIADFANQNKSLTEMLLKGVGGAVAAKNTGKAAMDQLREKDRLERERNAQYSASISGLAAPRTLGPQKPLRRIDGSRVFTNNGRMA